MARKDIGRKPEELDMLLSPSRGLQGGDDDEASLRNPDMQERLRKHIDAKLSNWASTHVGASSSPEQRKRQDEELGIILLDLRKLREGITSIRRVDSFAREVYEASALLSLFASNTPQLASSLPHLVLALHPALQGPPPPAPSAGLETSLSALSISSSSPDPATRAFFLALHLLHSHLLPASTSSAIPVTPSSASSSSPSLSTFLPTLFSLLSASRLPPPTWKRSTCVHPDPHISLLLSLYTALLRNSYVTLARLLSHLPPPPPSITSHLSALHLPTSFNPLASLLLSFLPALRANRIFPVVEKAYRFPPDKTGWLARGLLFEFEAAAEGMRETGEGGKEGKAESWEDEVDEEEEGRRKEAERRAEEWVIARKGGA
ncbi:hypothetical protein JCM8547_008236 [Rhodosporidiobolus lusitaniae]